jgi:hypothetical protein
VANKSTQRQQMIRWYREETGKTEIEMRDVAAFAVTKGWPLAQPADPLDLLAKEFTRAAREEVRKDEATGRPYRANHAIPAPGGQFTLWIDIDQATRKPMHKSLMNRREQMVGDGLQLTLDAEHWNRIHQDEEPIIVPMDFTDDVEWRMNAPNEDEDVA